MLLIGAKAQTQEEIEAYPDYAEKFANQKLTWESVKVHTDNGYTLTAFHVTGSTETGPFTPDKPVVICQHGMGGTGASFIGGADCFSCDEHEGYENNASLPTQLAYMGFDVWLQNNSGVEYSQTHDVYTVEDEEFWEIDWQTFAQYDFPALTREIQRRTGVKKVAMLGHS